MTRQQRDGRSPSRTMNVPAASFSRVNGNRSIVAMSSASSSAFMRSLRINASVRLVRFGTGLKLPAL